MDVNGILYQGDPSPLFSQSYGSGTWMAISSHPSPPIDIFWLVVTGTMEFDDFPDSLGISENPN